MAVLLGFIYTKPERVPSRKHTSILISLSVGIRIASIFVRIRSLEQKKNGSEIDSLESQQRNINTCIFISAHGRNHAGEVTALFRQVRIATNGARCLRQGDSLSA